MIRRIERWEAGIAAAIVLATVGLLNRNPTLLLAAAIPLTYVAYGSASTAPVPPSVHVVRRIRPSPVPPAYPVTVEVEVTNDGEGPLPDVRVIDGVPDSLSVVDGTPREGTTLDVGESTTVEYVVMPRRGEYEFDDPRVRVRSAAAGALATTVIEAGGDGRLSCRLDAEAPPLADRGTDYVGTVTANQPGRGVEFHSTREYRTGDPASRIDWRHYAKRGELTTVNYARQVAATVVLVVDARDANRVVAGPGHPTAVELSAYAATRATGGLLRRGHDVAVAILGIDGADSSEIHWLPAGSGPDQRRLALDRFRTAIDAEGVDVDLTGQVHEVIERSPPGAQLALFSPLLDDAPLAAVEAWAAIGNPLVVLAPDVVPTNTVAGQYAGIRRRARLARCQTVGARTIDWRRGTRLQVVLEYAFAAESRLATRTAAGSRTGGES